MNLFLRSALVLATLGTIPLMAADKTDSESSAMPVLFSEGVVHGFVVLSTLDGVPVAHGELLQSARGGEVKGRMIFKFKDGSLSDETTEFSQSEVFSLKSYHQIQRGPSFPKDVDYKIERLSAKEGRYKVRTKDHKNGEVYEDEDKFEMPADLYNGLVIAIAKNIKAGNSRKIHMLAMTPKPRLIEVNIHPVGPVKIMHGGRGETATHYALDPDLGFWLGTAAKVIGKDPPDQHLWMATTTAPGFVKFEGPMFQGGPVWRISLGAPCFPTKADKCN